MYGQLIPDGNIQGGPGACAFIKFGDNTAFGPGASISRVSTRHLVQRIALAGGIQYQQAFYRSRKATQHLCLFTNKAVTLTDTDINNKNLRVRAAYLNLSCKLRTVLCHM